MKKETIVILILGVLLVAATVALVIQRQRYNALLEAYEEQSNGSNTIGGSVGGLVDTLIKLFV